MTVPVPSTPNGATARFLLGDVHDRLAEIPDQSVDLVVTSPPFLALRSYLPADHPDKGREIGSEATPAEFLDTLLELTAEWGRVLAPHGSLAIELGDTYAGSGGAGGDYNPDGLRAGQNGFTGSAHRSRHEQPRQWSGGTGWPLEKSLVGIPTLYAWSLAYGRNLLTGEESPAGQWRIRNVVAWVRPNPPVGALADKFRPATSYITVATRARDRWFDLDAVRTKHDHRPHTDNRGGHKRDGIPGRTGQMMNPIDENGHRIQENPAGAPPLDWWEITPGGYSGAHYAVWPPELCKRLIDSMCPRRVCTTCGQPSRRIVGDASYVNAKTGTEVSKSAWVDGGERLTQGAIGRDSGAQRVATTTGWSSCSCSSADGVRLDGFHTGTGWRPGHVLDPFVGSGTTLAVASGMGRASTGIDLDERNLDLVRGRVGMFLHEETAP